MKAIRRSLTGASMASPSATSPLMPELVAWTAWSRSVRRWRSTWSGTASTWSTTCSAGSASGAHDQRPSGRAFVKVRLSPPAAATRAALPEIVALLDRVFPSRRPRAPDLEWQYLRNPAGPARYVNAYTESGKLVAHYALLPTPPLADPPVAFTGTYFSLNTAVDPAAGVPGLMVATARALFRG